MERQKQEEEKKEMFYLLVHRAMTTQLWLCQPGARSHGWQGSKHLGHLLLLFLDHSQEAGSGVEWLEHKLVPTWDGCITGGGFTR